MKKLFFLSFAIMFIFTLSGCGSNNYNYEEDQDNPFLSKSKTRSSSCSCSGNVYNCDDFSTHREAQKCYEDCGGLGNDVHQLDRDKDGSACETL